MTFQFCRNKNKKSQYLEVDVVGICSVHYKCDGCTGNSKRCCSSYEVVISRREMQNIIDYIPFAASFCPNLNKEGYYLNVFEEIAGGLYSIDTNEDGTCVFSYFKGNRIVCSLHTVSKKIGISVKKVKPMSCILWPLAISDEEPKILSIHDDIDEFGCITYNIEEKFSLCPSIAKNIEIIFGNKFRKDLQNAVGKGMLWKKILVDECYFSFH